MENDNRVEIDMLKELAQEQEEILMKGQEVTKKRDITPIFWIGLKQKLKKAENPIIVIRGQQTLGKSTCACYLAYILNDMIRKLGLETSLPQQEEINIHNYISANQLEFLRITRQPENKIKRVWCIIDEFSDMSGTGSNSTTEVALLKSFFKICAQKWIYQIYCTPGKNYDEYGLIILNVIDSDKQKGITNLEVYYNDPSSQNQIPLGYITLKVHEIINKSWYKEYQTKKHKAIELLMEYNISDPRVMEAALITLIAYDKNKELAELGEKDVNVIAADLDGIKREVKAVYSIIGDELVKQRISGMIGLIASIGKSKQELTRNRQKPLTTEQENGIKRRIEITKKKFDQLYQDNLNLIHVYLNYLSLGKDNIVKNHIIQLCKKYNIPIKEEQKNDTSE